MTGKKQINPLILAGVVLFALLVCMVVLLLIKPPAPAPAAGAAEPVVLRLFPLKQEDLFSVVLVDENKGFSIVNHNGTYHVDGYDDSRISQQKISTFINGILNLYTVDIAKSSITEEDIPKFGFDTPTVILSLYDVEQQQTLMLLGNKHPLEDNWYLLLDKYDIVFLISDTDAKLLQLIQSGFYNTDFYPEITDADVAQLSGITISGRDIETISFVLEDFSDMSNLAYYRMTEPVVLDIETKSMSSSILSHIQRLSGDDIAGPALELAQYGLDEPAYTLTLDYQNQILRVLFGNSENGFTYAMREDADEVLRIKDEATAFLKTDYKTIIGRSVYQKNITLVGNIKIISNGETYSIDIKGAGGNLRSVYQGEEIGANDTLLLYRALCGIALEGAIEEEPEGVAAELSITFSFRDGGPADTIELIPINDRQSAILINGSADFYTYRRTAGIIAGQLEQFIQAAGQTPA